MPGPQRAPSDHVADPLQLVRVGRIVSADLETGKCVVEVGDPDEESVETTEIQWGTLRAGKTRIWSPPSVGEQVVLFCPAGDIAQAIPLGALFSSEFPAPGNSKRELIQFEDDAVFAYDPEAHHLDVTLPAGGTTRVESDGGVTIVGDTRIEGTLLVTEKITGQSDLQISDDGQFGGKVTASDDVIGGGKSLKSHVHSGVTAGGAASGPPQ